MDLLDKLPKKGPDSQRWLFAFLLPVWNDNMMVPIGILPHKVALKMEASVKDGKTKEGGSPMSSNHTSPGLGIFALL